MAEGKLRRMTKTNKQFIMFAISFCLAIFTGIGPAFGEGLISITPSSLSVPPENWKKYLDVRIDSLPRCDRIIPEKGWIGAPGWALYYMQGGQLKACANSTGFQTFKAISLEDIWAAGVKGDLDSPVLYHWDGLTWREYPAPYFPQPEWTRFPNFTVVNDLFFLSPDKGWAVGGISGEVGEKDVEQGFMFLWDGKIWKAVSPPGLKMQGISLQSIYMISEKEGWVVSDTNQVYRWNGKWWTEMYDENGNPFDLNIRKIFGLSPNSIWLAGENLDPSGGIEGVIYYWNGQKWREQYRGGNASIETISMISSSFGWAVGGYRKSGKEGIILIWDGRTWNPYQVPDSVFFRSIVIMGDREAWIFGEDYQKIRYFAYQLSNQPKSTRAPNPSKTYTVQKTSSKTDTPSPSVTPSTIPVIHTDSRNQEPQIEWISRILLSVLLMSTITLILLLRKRK